MVTVLDARTHQQNAPDNLPVLTQACFLVLEEAAAAHDTLGRMHTSYELFGTQHRKRGAWLAKIRILEQLNLVRRTGKHWSTGVVTDLGRLVLERRSYRRRVLSNNSFALGVAASGGTRYPRTLVHHTTSKLLSRGEDNYKLGRRVTKGRHRGLSMVGVTLEEGTTCPQACTLRDRCYGGGMPHAKRVRWQGEETGDAIAHAIHRAGDVMVRWHILGDVPSAQYVWSTLGAITASKRSALFGFTHHQPETMLGALIAHVAQEEWARFSVRTSYEHGKRKPIPLRSAVIIAHPDQAKEHNAIVCPEQQGKVKDCASCGYCWHTQRPVAFLLHREQKEMQQDSSVA